MRTKLEYEVNREEEWDIHKQKTVNKIEFRGFGITITGKEKEVNNAMDLFDTMLIESGFELAKCPVIENLENGNIEYYDYVSIQFVDEKEEIKEIYKEFKEVLRSG